MFDVGFTEPMQGGHRSVLKEIRHDGQYSVERSN
jgi:hypothetical protein